MNLLSSATVDSAVNEARAAATGREVRGIAVIRNWDPIATGQHLTVVWGIAASPDGRWLATAGHDGSVVLWDALTGQRARTLAGHGDTAWSVAFSQDSQLFATGSEEIKVWEVATGRQVAELKGHKQLVAALAFHPGRHWLLSGGRDRTIRVWDADLGKPLGVLHVAGSAIHGAVFRADGRWAFVSSAEGRVLGWDLSRPLNFPKQPDRVLDGREGALWSIAFDPEGRTLATGSERGAIILWDGSTFDRLTTLRGGHGQIRAVSFSKDGGLLAGSAYDAPTIVWDLSGVRQTLRELNWDWHP